MKEHHSRNLYFGFVSLFCFLLLSTLPTERALEKKTKKNRGFEMKPSGGAVYFKRYCVHSFILSSHFEKRKEKPRTKREKQKEENATERTKSARNDSRRNVPDTRRCCFEERDVCVRGLPASPLFFSYFFFSFFSFSDKA